MGRSANLRPGRLMIAADDSWYVRFPDGRIIRAGSTSFVRQNIQQGFYSPNCMVRRPGEQDWLTLERTREFADLTGAITGNLDNNPPDVPPVRDEPPREPTSASSSVGARLDLKQLRTAGIRPVVQEMLAALDVALMRRKLIVAALMAALCGFIMTSAQLIPVNAAGVEQVVWTIAGALLLLIVSAGLGMLVRLTFVELQRMRPAKWREGRAGLGGLTFRLILANTIVGGIAVGVPLSLLALSRWLVSLSDTYCTSLANGIGILAILASVCLVPLGIALLLVGPILVFEGCTVFTALRMWLALLRQQFGKILLNEVIAVAIASTLALPFLLAVLATVAFRLDDTLAVAGWSTRTILSALALSPSLAFLVVANVFLFVNLRYENGRR